MNKKKENKKFEKKCENCRFFDPIQVDCLNRNYKDFYEKGVCDNFEWR